MNIWIFLFANAIGSFIGSLIGHFAWEWIRGGAMTDTKCQALLEVAYEMLSRIHTDLLHDRKFEEAAELFDIMRKLILFSKKVGSPKITENTMNALKRMGEKVHTED